MKTSKTAHTITNENVIRRGLKRVLRHLDANELCDFANEVKKSEKYRAAVYHQDFHLEERKTLEDLRFVCETARDLQIEFGGCNHN